MKKKSLVYLEDILEAIEKILEYVHGISLDEFEENTEKQDAVIRRFEIIGEASRRLEDSFRETYDQIPWVQMVDFRNVLIHGYDTVELGILWKVIQDGDLEKAKKQIEELRIALQGASL
jgi:uncharacterized protein with HEPN domain